jgi:hypothetical protein
MGAPDRCNPEGTGEADGRAALIAEIAGAPPRTAFDDGIEALLVRRAGDPLAVFSLLRGFDRPADERPDTAGPAARIRGKLAGMLSAAAGTPRPASPAAGEPARFVTGRRIPSQFVSGASDDTPCRGEASPFVPSADDIAFALDGRPGNRPILEADHRSANATAVVTMTVRWRRLVFLITLAATALTTGFAFR